MSAAISLSEPALPALERARGRLRIAISRRDKTNFLSDLYQEGCLKVRFPRAGAAALELVAMNNSGGVAPGDDLETALTLHAGSAATYTSAGAERFYRARRGEASARVRHHLHLGPGAALEWLPLESIVFDNSALDRTIAADMAEDARLLLVESMVFGRITMGERLRALRLVDRIHLRRGGRLVVHDALRLEGAASDLLARPAIAAGANALGTIMLAAPGAEAALALLRICLADACLADPRLDASATLREGVLFARILAADGAALRTVLVPALALLRSGAPLPRNWRC